MLSKGCFLLDIEVELAWGIIDRKINKERMRKAAINVRKYLSNIINILETHNLPVTWGILGHLILNPRKGIHEATYPDITCPTYKWPYRDWFHYDQTNKMVEQPAFYGKDIVDRIISYISETEIPHDVACHSFSHQLFGDPGCSKKVAEVEVTRCMKLIEENYGTQPIVFIFPRDFPGHFDVLRQNGIIAYRGPITPFITQTETKKGMWNLIRKYTSKAFYFTSFYRSTPPPVVSPTKEHGLINIPASMCYNKKPFIPLQLVISKAIKGINRALKERKIFHLYTHLINFAEAPNSKVFLNGFEEIVAHASTLTTEKKFETTTIKRIAKNYFEEVSSEINS